LIYSHSKVGDRGLVPRFPRFPRSPRVPRFPRVPRVPGIPRVPIFPIFPRVRVPILWWGRGVVCEFGASTGSTGGT
jgi:hypothetical protein